MVYPKINKNNNSVFTEIKNIKNFSVKFGRLETNLISKLYSYMYIVTRMIIYYYTNLNLWKNNCGMQNQGQVIVPCQCMEITHNNAVSCIDVIKVTNLVGEINRKKTTHK